MLSQKWLIVHELCLLYLLMPPLYIKVIFITIFSCILEA